MYRLCLIALVVRGEEESDEETDEREEQNFSIPNEDLDGVQLEVLPGNKKNSKWHILNNTFICTRHGKCPKSYLSRIVHFQILPESVWIT